MILIADTAHRAMRPLEWMTAARPLPTSCARIGAGRNHETGGAVNRLDAFIQGDRMIPHFGMEIEEAAEGLARVSATVREEFLNTHNVAHGALIFAVIDVAFAICVNAVIDAMGVQWSFNILRAARPGDRVTAVCRTIHSGSRLIVVEYEVRTQNGVLLAKGQATALPVRGASEASTAASSGWQAAEK